MNIAFRVDATSQIGTGHFMRCMALAEELQRFGARIQFVCRNLPQYLRDALEAGSIEFGLLEHDLAPNPDCSLTYSHWIDVSQAQDAQATKKLLSGLKWDWLIVDHYALDINWESALRSSVRQIMVIDDIADRRHDCDVLLDQNFYQNMQGRYAERVSPQCRQLLGPRFALLRDEFRESRKHARQRTGPVKRILVFFGGVDAKNYTGRVIEVLSKFQDEALKVDVVIGTQHPCREQIEKFCKSFGYHCHVQTKCMAELMVNADLAIGAGGIAMWERCCLGLPSLSICIADNQRRQIADAAEQGMVYSIPTYDDLTRSLERNIGLILENESLRKLVSRISMQEVDGLGVNRVIEALGISNIKIREANASDSSNLFKWRNHQTILAASKNSAPISLVEHEYWFTKVQADEGRVLLIGEIDNQPIGVVRFDKTGESALVSIYLVPEAGLKGMGRNLLLRAEEWLKVHDVNIREVKAEVLGENSASQHLFEGAHYQLESLHYVKEF